MTDETPRLAPGQTFCSLAEAAEWLGRSPQTLRRWSRERVQGFPQPVLHGARRWSFIVAELVAWDEQRREERPE